MKKLIKELCSLGGISGHEHCVREYIAEQIKDHCEYSVDNLGNIIALKKGKERPKNRVMICAHMDEVGMIVTYITDEGLLRVSPVGGVDSKVIFGRAVEVGEAKLHGVIGAKPKHHMSKKDAEKSVPFEDIFVDIGASSKKQAEEHVRLGDPVHFCSDFSEFGNNMIKAKALDDRAGCAMMIEMMKKDLSHDTYFVFTVQEELGLRGATTATYTVNPDIAIVLETTTAADIPGVSGENRVCLVGNGAVVSYMDRSTIYDRQLYDLAFETAKTHAIPCQTKTMVAGGNDSGAIHVSRDGVRTLAISAPCRYLHSPCTVLSYDDLMAVYNLADIIKEQLYNL